jgi:signal transduction histidine kinase/ligand-binding sensor domain-containing protein
MRLPKTWYCFCARLLGASSMILASTTAAYGLDPARALSQFVRDEWGVERGFVGGVVRAIAETPDGYLWLGTDEGLVRFDGTTFTLVSESDVSASGAAVLDLAVDGNGDLWIRRRSPIVQRLSKGRFEDALWSLSPKEEFVMAIARGRNSSVLLAARFHGIARHTGGRFETMASWPAEDPVRAMVEAPDGRVWLGTDGSGVFCLRDGRITRGPDDLGHDTVEALSPAADQSLWIATRRGVTRWNGHDARTEGAPASLRRLHVLRMLRDRDANVWLGTTGGLVRIGPDGSVVSDGTEARARGATVGAVTALFEDREGSLWIGGAAGIARLRQGGFTAFGRAEGLPADHVGPVHVDAGGRTWFAPVQGGLYWLQHGHVERVTAAGLDRDVVYAIGGAGDDVWLGRKHGGLTRLRVAGGTLHAVTFTAQDGLAPGHVVALHQSRDGTIWAGMLGAGASVGRPGGGRIHFITYSTAEGLASNIVSSIAGTGDDTVWFATPQGLSAFAGGRWRTYGAAEGLPSSAINCLLATGADATLWVGTAAGLVRIEAGRVVANPLPPALREQIFGLAEDRSGALWVATSNRLMQVPVDRLRGGQLSEGDVREFEKADGLRSAESTRRERSLIRSPDGRIWVSTTGGLAVVDPARVPQRFPASAAVRAISVDGVPFDLFGTAPLRIPAHPERIVFELVGVSLSFPRQVRMRYRLDGIDRDWSAPTTASEAIYTHLAPGPYRFRVMSSTGDGRWRESDASVVFVVAPAVWQTFWFRLVVLATGGALAFAVYRLRTRQLTRQLNVRFDERLTERTRIAQELHDTLLQGVLSASMQLHSAVDDLPPDTPNRQELERVLRLMNRVSDEGRVAVRGLRTGSGDDLPQAFCLVQQEYASRAGADFEVTTEGRVRPIHPLIRDEVYRIGREALVNAFRHARAKKIDVEFEYSPRHLRMLIRDDGCGVDPNILHDGRDGHWGLPGMRERARCIGGQLTLSSRAGSGTEVELVLPASVAFAPPEGHSHESREHYSNSHRR